MNETPNPPTAPAEPAVTPEKSVEQKTTDYEKNDLMLIRVRALKRWVEDIYTKEFGKELHVSPEFIEQFQLVMIYQLDQCVERMQTRKRTTLMKGDATFVQVEKVNPASLPKRIRDALKKATQ